MLRCLLILVAASASSCSPAGPLPKPQESANQGPHVVVIVMENQSPVDVLGAPYIASLVRRFAIIPDLCHSMHDCAVEAGDAWLGTVVPKILGSPAWQQDGVLFVVWDEGGRQRDQPALLIAAKTLVQPRDRRYDHYSLLATIEDLFRIPRLAQAAQATTLADSFPRLR